MIIVYSAANNLEAHMIKGVLEQQEIPAYIQGEHLQSGAGELPAMSGLVKISVDNVNRDAARKIIKEWEAQEHTGNTKNMPNEIVRSGTNYLNLIASFVAGAIAMHFYLKTPEINNGLDYDKDGTNDVVWTYQNNVLTKIKQDRNFDSKIDSITSLKNGLYEKTDADENYDGQFETEYYYENDELSLSKSDTDNDDVIDLTREFQFKTSKSIAKIFNPKTKLIKKIEYYDMAKIKSAKLDTNDDGNMDVVITYDFFEEEISRKPIATK